MWNQSISLFFLTFYSVLLTIVIINNVVIVSGRQEWDSVILPQTPLPSRLPRNIDQSSLYYAVDPCWLSILEES